MIFFLFSALILSFLNTYTVFFKDLPSPFRKSILSSLILVLLLIAFSTELLSVFDLLNKFYLSTVWIFLNGCLLLWWLIIAKGGSYNLALRIFKDGYLHFIYFIKKLGVINSAAIFSILSLTFVVAWVSTPNNLDSLSYHLSRLGYWIQNMNVEHYPSHIERAISFSPFSEYIHLQTFLLTDSEVFFQLVQWTSVVGILMYVSLIVEGLTESSQALKAALCFCVTLPILVLESMTTQNDLVVSFFILATAHYTLDFLNSARTSTLCLLSASVALGIMTKGTFVFYTIPFGLYLFIELLLRRSWGSIIHLGLGVTFLTTVVNIAFWIRTFRIYGSPIGTFGNGNQNYYHSPSAIVSSLSKHLALHLGFVSPGDRYNIFIEKLLIKFHHFLKISINEPGMGMTFKMNKLNFNEDFAHNFLAIWIVIACIATSYTLKGNKLAIRYLSLAMFSFLIFCTFIAYQTYGSRLHIPFFILMSPIVGISISLLPALLNNILIYVLWINALPFALLSANHPLISTRWFFDDVFPVLNKYVKLNINPRKMLNLRQESVLLNSREKIIWGDQWSSIKPMVEYINLVNARNIGFYFSEASLDYGYQMVLRHSGRKFQHIGVTNPSKCLEKKDFHPDCIISETDKGNFLHYNNLKFFKTWSNGSHFVYLTK